MQASDSLYRSTGSTKAHLPFQLRSSSHRFNVHYNHLPRCFHSTIPANSSQKRSLDITVSFVPLTKSKHMFFQLQLSTKAFVEPSMVWFQRPFNVRTVQYRISQGPPTNRYTHASPDQSSKEELRRGPKETCCPPGMPTVWCRAVAHPSLNFASCFFRLRPQRNLWRVKPGPLRRRPKVVQAIKRLRSDCVRPKCIMHGKALPL